MNRPQKISLLLSLLVLLTPSHYSLTNTLFFSSFPTNSPLISICLFFILSSYRVSNVLFKFFNYPSIRLVLRNENNDSLYCLRAYSISSSYQHSFMVMAEQLFNNLKVFIIQIITTSLPSPYSTNGENNASNPSMNENENEMVFIQISMTIV